MPGAKRVRLVDVARHLDVAPSTVSRALSGSDSIPESTRLRVQRAARELGYRANPTAVGLKSGVTLNIGLIASFGGSWYSGTLATAADAAAANAGYDFLVATADRVDGNSGLLARAERLGQRVDGAIIVDVSDTDSLLERLIENLHIPVVTVGCSHPKWPSVTIDNHHVGVIAGQHLAQLGHRSVAALSLATPSGITIDNMSDRILGCRSAMPDAAIRQTILPRSETSERRPLILDAVGDATAVFCTSDELAIEVMAVLSASGRHVPDDVSVIGVDNHPLADAVGLTSVAQDPRRIGAQATSLLLAQLGDESTAKSVVDGVSLNARRTTAPVQR